MSRGQASPTLETSQLSKSFGGLRAVREVSLSLHTGELHALIGPNGAGKSTLVNLLSGELKPTGGSIRLLGRDVTGEAPWSMTRLGVARSFQRTNIFRHLSVLENARLAVQAREAAPRRMLNLADAEGDIIDGARQALARVGLSRGEERIAGTLSHGEQRQLEIAMTLATSPRVVVLDEPLAGMGQEEGERMAGLLKTLVKDHAVLLVEHDMDFVFRVADWMTVLVEGKVLAEGKPEDIRSNTEVQKAYLGGHG
ncbi:MAG: ABC transporter ATP-binding protein [Hyphomicrobiaceae bacterium]|nr:MAG: ABC transporter ATP-binding protein [Hyphomicrobiaceae bacterium]